MFWSRQIGWGWILVLAGCACLPDAAHGQMVSVMASASHSSTTGESNALRPYEVGYRQVLYKDLSLSFDYVNEGHFTGHHPDGYGMEAWYSFSPVRNYLTLAVGGGAFYYFDTTTSAGGSSTDVHGFAPMLSLAARGRIWKKLYWNASADWIEPSHDIKTELVSLGIGYWFVADDVPAGREPPGLIEHLMSGAVEGVERDEVSIYLVKSVINISGNPGALGGAAEYRYRFRPFLEGTATYIYEGNPKVARRSGVSLQAWPVRTGVSDHIEIGAGFGAYVFIDTKRQPEPGRNATAAVAPIVSLMTSYRATPDWFIRVIWDRVVSNYNRDADIFRVGFGRTI